MMEFIAQLAVAKTSSNLSKYKCPMCRGCMTWLPISEHRKFAHCHLCRQYYSIGPGGSLTTVSEDEVHTTWKREQG